MVMDIPLKRSFLPVGLGDGKGDVSSIECYDGCCAKGLLVSGSAPSVRGARQTRADCPLRCILRFESFDMYIPCKFTRPAAPRNDTHFRATQLFCTPRVSFKPGKGANLSAPSYEVKPRPSGTCKPVPVVKPRTSTVLYSPTKGSPAARGIFLFVAYGRRSQGGCCASARRKAAWRGMQHRRL